MVMNNIKKVLILLFIHEIIHGILDTMGETELSSNEKFVNAFAGYLYQVIKQIKD